MLELVWLCVCPVGNWNANCGYEEALHSNGEVLVLPVKGTRLARGLSVNWLKTVECGCQGGGKGVPSWIQLADPVEY